ncbi:MAG: YbaB/EbfC family nucleoid-associated protein [Bdellovibrionales bacterium CG10_big_fil_rev_8_21_14_0_10_45_34]|nr:MAG: YbaB/EbfC family nucleoid-associated protein [Bdellovibrionales bacterium CG10_big_fil_rev_8_21_14_0_10_45_34]
MKGFPGGMQQFIKQANQMQSRIQKLQEQLETKEYAGTAGGGSVSAIATGKLDVKSITIKPEVLEAADTEMVQDLVMIAVNEALKLAKAERDAEMQKTTGGMGIPGIF